MLAGQRRRKTGLRPPCGRRGPCRLDGVAARTPPGIASVAPGFEFSEFELADAASLAQAYPAHASLIARLAAKA